MLRASPAIAIVALLSACSNTNPETNGSPHPCTVDADCGDHAYCTEAHVCRTDCFKDVECFGPTTEVQCTSHGQCIQTSGDAASDASIDAPSDADMDGKPSDAKSDGAETETGP